MLAMGIKVNKREKNKVLKALKPLEEEGQYDMQKASKRLKRHQPVKIEELEYKEPPPNHSLKGYETIEIRSSKGKLYKIVVPQSYVPMIPKTWQWTEQRYRVAEHMAEGLGVREICRMEGINHMAVYAWLQHPEFKEHVDGLVLETGFANKRERIAGMTRLVRKLFDKVMEEMDGVALTDKSIGAVLSAIPIIARHVAQEKEEFVEQSVVEQTTNFTGTLVATAVKVDDLLAIKSSEDQEKMRAELAKMGDQVVGMLTGNSPEVENKKDIPM